MAWLSKWNWLAKDRAGTDRIDHETQLADGRIGQHPLDIIGGQCHDARQQGRQQADHDHSGAPAGHALEGRIETGQQVDTRIDHRGSMDEGSHRGGGFHCIRQPGMEGHLGGLGRGRDQEPKSHHAQDCPPADYAPGPGRC